MKFPKGSHVDLRPFGSSVGFGVVINELEPDQYQVARPSESGNPSTHVYPYSILNLEKDPIVYRAISFVLANQVFIFVLAFLALLLLTKSLLITCLLTPLLLSVTFMLLDISTGASRYCHWQYYKRHKYPLDLISRNLR